MRELHRRAGRVQDPGMTDGPTLIKRALLPFRSTQINVEKKTIRRRER